MSERLYPKERVRRDKSGRRYEVAYELTFAGGAISRWSGYYRTRFGAQVAAWWNVRKSPWGGTADIVNKERPDASS